MKKKRIKAQKRKKMCVVTPIVFFGMLGTAIFLTDQYMYADEISKFSETQQVVEQPSDSLTVSEEFNGSDEAEENSSDTVTTPEMSEVHSINDETTYTTQSSDSSEESLDKGTSDQLIESTKKDTNVEINLYQTTDLTIENNVSQTTDNTETPNRPNTNSNSSEKKKPTQIPKEKIAVVTNEKTTAKDEMKATAPKFSIFRVYNPNAGEHLHTMNSFEKDYLVSLGWRYEGVSMVVTNTGRQLFRIYNPNSGEHHFTLNRHEIDMLKKAGWRYEGIAWLTQNSGIAIYRVFNPNARGAGSHHYTMNVNERNNLLRSGWRNEGIGWYTLGTKSRNEIMIDWFYARQGKVTYSMTNRNGPNSYDCSSAVFNAMIEAGYLKTGTWIGNTDTLFSYEGKLFRAISSKDIRRGDIFISGKKGNSGGAAGHTGIATSNIKIIHCNYVDNGIAETVIVGRTGSPCYWFRFI